ncbi:hypothetical protein PCC7424_5596 (plasmid) [Gloeothece citriformis PCC 7424]|uniref:FHA domain-containing protein n=1 Tax=Gloeothece citriformis (strain PCC 7424) TaxID=65393 RepID=B7KMY6_GLOC7|nr:FHA domain-containing protein [Gloeothece citriformis]ACK74158.1 hypothetical protein PCC7424_5596 [Gloeothece citriformis PCC 7424]
MNTLRLSIENQDKSWTLKPDREYIIGCDTDCHISLPEEEISEQQLKFDFDPQRNIWYVYNLDDSDSVYINSQSLTEYPITHPSYISVGNKLTFVVTPEGFDSSISHTKFQELLTLKYINRVFFDKEDPEQLRGTWLKNFSFSFNRNLALIDRFSKRRIAFKDQSKLYTVREDLYKDILIRLDEYKKNDYHLTEQLHFKLINYRDYKYENDRDRIYLEIVRNTIRCTKITTFLRFFVNGDNLYIAADSYALGRMSKRKVLWQTIILFLLISPGTWFIYVFTVGLGLVVALWYLYSSWINFIRSLFQGEPFLSALRVNFPKNIKSNAFDLDDSYMFLKSIYPLIISSLEDTLRKHNLLDKDLEEILKGISNDIGKTSINIDTGGGGIIGSVISGLNNTINNKSQTKG